MACPFLSLPFEIIDHILCLTDPETVSDVSQTSRAFYAYIRDNTSLWRSLFAKYFDLPEDHRQNVDWKSHVQSRIRAKHILFAFYSPRTPTIELENLCRTLIQVVRSASPGPGLSKNIAWLADPDVWCSSPVTYIHPRLIHLPQLQPELRVLECNIVGNVENRFNACAFVYDMRNYHHSNLYGPFISRFSENEPLQTDYLHLMCLMKVLLNNFHSCHRHPYRRMKRGFKNTRSMTAPPSSVDGDWAGVQGVWMRFLSWMSRRDYREYNWPNGLLPDPDDELDPSIFDQPWFRESHVLLQVEMYVTSIDLPSRDHPERRPTIHFEGITEGGGSTEVAVSGAVYDEGGDVTRWSLSSIAGEKTTLETEGVQIGGVQSAAGWVGCWTRPRHEVHTLAGPSWAFKLV